MGKVKRTRQKYHSAAVKCDEKKKQKAETAANPNVAKGPIALPPIFPTEGLFSGTHIDISKLATDPEKKDKDFDVKSTISSRSESGQLKKKDRQKQRHERWLEKIETIKLLKQKEKDAKKRAKTPIVGDLHVLTDALPDVTYLLNKTSKHKSKKQKKKARSTLKSKDRQKLMLDEVSKFKQLQHHPKFQANPLSTIKEHLTNQLLQEEVMEEG
ncbi:ribosome biogenesis protein SLX9 homolog [Glandiceps talaboti]